MGAQVYTLQDMAVPSCVVAGTVAENVRCVSGHVAEVGLCFFETEGCLRYGATDMPASLATLPLQWHVHLPVDLPWAAGGCVAARAALAVVEKAAFLPVRYAVLHAPQAAPAAQGAVLHDFATCWNARTTMPLLLENIAWCDLVSLPRELLDVYDFCLDVGHLFAFGQDEIMSCDGILQKIRLVHWSAPGRGDEHAPLTELTPQQHVRARALAQALPCGARHMIEVFRWDGVQKSAPVLAGILEG